MQISLPVNNRQIRVKVLVRNPTQTNKIKNYVGIIDTGAMDTLISKDVINDLNLIPNGNTIKINDPFGNSFISQRYSTYVQFDGLSKTYSLECLKHTKKNIDLIIGMDMLENIEFKMDNFIVILTD